MPHHFRAGCPFIPKASQHRLDTGHKLPGIKGFGDIIVGTKLQSKDLVDNVIPGCQHDDGGPSSARHFPAEIMSADIGKHQIQYDQVGHEGLEQFQGLLPGGSDGHRKLFPFQDHLHEFKDGGFVIDNQDPRHFISLAFPLGCL